MITMEKQAELPILVETIKNDAEHGEAHAQYSLGLLFAGGKGVAQAYSLAAQWFTKAAQQGNTLAQCMLGLMYDYGLGIMQDVVQADTWYRIAGASGSLGALAARSVVEKDMAPEQIDAAQTFARAWLECHPNSQSQSMY